MTKFLLSNQNTRWLLTNTLQLLNNMVDCFLECLDDLKNRGILSKESLEKYSDYNIHSYLQYCLIKATRNTHLIGVPEYKIRLSEPIDKKNIDPRLKVGKIRYVRTIRADVGFIKEGKLVGIGEVYTPDEIHGCLPSIKLIGPWITPYNKLIHMAMHENNKQRHMAKYKNNIKFMVLVIGLWILPQWEDAKRRKLSRWDECWKCLARRLSEHKRVMAIYIKGLDDIEIEVEIINKVLIEKHNIYLLN